jgi:hypothetical protein
MTTPENKNPQKAVEQTKQLGAKSVAPQQAVNTFAKAVAPERAATEAFIKASDTKQAVNTATTKTVKKADNVVSMSKSSSEKAASENFAHASEKLAHTIDIASRLMNETFSIGREQLEACIEASNITAECAQKIGESLYESTNAAISENVEHYKHFFSCRTASDVLELQTRLAQTNIERFLGNNSAISTMLFNFSAKASEPFADKLSDATDRIQRIFK